MTKKIAVINGHPNREAFNVAVAHAYVDAARTSGAEVRVIAVADLDFNPNLQYGYQKRMELEPDLLSAWETICWAEHLVWIHPVWWGGLPAITKGFIDRLFLPGMAFKYRDNSVWWDKLLKGKSAHIMTTLDQPGWVYRLMFGRPSVNQLKRAVLQFCGVTPVRVTYLSVMRNSEEKSRQKLLEKARRLGAGLK